MASDTTSTHETASAAATPAGTTAAPAGTAQESSAEFAEFVDQITDLTVASGVREGTDAFATRREQIEKVLAWIGETFGEEDPAPFDRRFVDQAISDVDAFVGRRLDAILHDEAFREIESTWRGLAHLVERTDFTQDIVIDVLDVSKDELAEDFADNELVESGFHAHVYGPFDQFGATPVSYVVGAYEFSPSRRDVDILRDVAGVCAMAHAPFIAATGAEFLGLESWSELPHQNKTSLRNLYRDQKEIYAEWNGFRDEADARYVVLTLPRYLARLPYDPKQNPARGLDYCEDVSAGSGELVWGSAAFLLAANINRSFAKYRWYEHMVGPAGGGYVERLNLHRFESMGQDELLPPTEVKLLDEMGRIISNDLGLVPLLWKEDTEKACFMAVNTVQVPRTFGQSKEGKTQAFNYRLATMLPYVLISSRLAHYLKVLQREEIGKQCTAGELQSQLDTWLQQYVADQDGLPAAERGLRPLRRAKVEVTETNDPGWYRMQLTIVPHIKYQGALVELSLAGRLEHEDADSGS